VAPASTSGSSGSGGQKGYDGESGYDGRTGDTRVEAGGRALEIKAGLPPELADKIRFP